MPSFPSNPDSITADWVNTCLTKSGYLTSGKVTNLRWQSLGTGQVADSVRFYLEYDRAGDGPATLAAKFPAQDQVSSKTAAMMGLYKKEVLFYREIAKQIGVRVPKTFAAEVNEDGSEFILLFEDLKPKRIGNQLNSCSFEDAKNAILQAAALHAPSWKNNKILNLHWLHPNKNAKEQVSSLYPKAQAVFKERYSEALEPEFMKVCNELAECETWFERGNPELSLIHGDFRLDNMLFNILNGEEEIGILDWQTVSVGHPMTDIGYFLGCGIGDQLRRRHEDQLLDIYCREMGARGVPLRRNEIWNDYVIGALHGVSTAVFSSAFVERTERGDANFLSMARGACALALQHKSLNVLKECK